MNTKKIEIYEALVYTVFATALLCIIYYLFFFDPVNYTVVLITEDRWAENATVVSYAITGILLLLLSCRQGPGLRRVVWAIIGMSALVIACDEISWGQRIIGIGAPSFIKENNLQGELTLHNLESFSNINSMSHKIAGYLILLWSLFSVVISFRLKRQQEMLMNIGIPIIHWKLLPIFILTSFFLIFYPTVKADEISEFLLGLAGMIWAVDLFLGNYYEKRPQGLAVLSVMGGAFLVVTLTSAVLVQICPGPIRGRINSMASSNGYPQFGMYRQAQVLYDYIYEHPQYIKPDTMLNHGKMLLEAGKESEAVLILTQAEKK